MSGNEAIKLAVSVGHLTAAGIEARRDADYWEMAAMHLLLCSKEIENCERCKSIKKKLEQP